MHNGSPRASYDRLASVFVEQLARGLLRDVRVDVLVAHFAFDRARAVESLDSGPEFAPGDRRDHDSRNPEKQDHSEDQAARGSISVHVQFPSLSVGSIEPVAVEVGELRLLEPLGRAEHSSEGVAMNFDDSTGH